MATNWQSGCRTSLAPRMVRVHSIHTFVVVVVVVVVVVMWLFGVDACTVYVHVQ